MAIHSEPHSMSSVVHARAILIAGPTAVGKSEIALLLARRIGGEIISVDSMQVYRGLDIGTAKPSSADRAGVPHHLIDVADVTEPFDVAQFIRLAQTAVAEIQSRGRMPILCGGTGLYFKAYLEGLGDPPPANEKLRAELEAVPQENLLRELQERDPATFDRIDRKNPRRVIRAVEVIRLTGRPFSAQRAAWPGAGPVGPPSAFFALKRDPAGLRERINARVEAMFQRGLVAETARLLELGLADNPTAMQAIGYRQVVEHLRSQRDLPSTVELVKSRTWQFARRQVTWLRGRMKPLWVDVASNEEPATVAARISAAYTRHGR